MFHGSVSESIVSIFCFLVFAYAIKIIVVDIWFARPAPSSPEVRQHKVKLEIRTLPPRVPGENASPNQPAKDRPWWLDEEVRDDSHGH